MSQEENGLHHNDEPNQTRSYLHPPLDSLTRGLYAPEAVLFFDRAEIAGGPGCSDAAIAGISRSLIGLGAFWLDFACFT